MLSVLGTKARVNQGKIGRFRRRVVCFVFFHLTFNLTKHFLGAMDSIDDNDCERVRTMFLQMFLPNPSRQFFRVSVDVFFGIAV